MFSEPVSEWTLSQAQCSGISQTRCWSPSWPGAALCHSRCVLKPNPVQDSFQRKILAAEMKPLPQRLNVPQPGAPHTAPLQGMFLTIWLNSFAPAMGTYTKTKSKCIALWNRLIFYYKLNLQHCLLCSHIELPPTAGFFEPCQASAFTGLPQFCWTKSLDTRARNGPMPWSKAANVLLSMLYLRMEVNPYINFFPFTLPEGELWLVE